MRAAGTSVGTEARGKQVGIESGSTGVTAIGNSQYGIADGIADGIPVAGKCKGQGKADGTALGDSQHGIAGGIADDIRVGARFRDQGQADGTALGGKTVMNGSPNKLPGTVTPRRRDDNSNIKLPGTAASTPGGEGRSRIPGVTRNTATGILANHGGTIDTSTGMLLEKGAMWDAESSLIARRRQVRCANKRRRIAL